MNALVHFAVGVTGGLLVLAVVDLPDRYEFLLTFGSGVWAMVPDGHWMLRIAGLDGPARVWRAFHRSAFANLCWFHRFLDRHETAVPHLETGVALAAMLLAVGLFFVVNDWR